MRVRWLAPFACKSGYAQATHDYLLALHRAGVELDIVPIVDANSEDLHPRYHELLPLVGKHLNDQDWPTHVVVHTVPGYANEFVTGSMATKAKKICVTTWEMDPIPEWIVKKLMVFDEIIVPSIFNLDLFLSQGRLVSVIPHCFDSDYWTVPKTKPEKPFQFYWIGDWSDRKNPVGVFKAFCHEFQGDEPVKLKMLSAGSKGALDDLELFKICCEDDNLPEIELVTDYLSESELPKLHQESHCYVSPHRAEGFGLGAFEACLVGNPVVATNYSGVTDFLQYPHDYLADYIDSPAISNPNLSIKNVDLGAGISVKSITKLEPMGINIRQIWAEPSLLDIAAGMRMAFDGGLCKSPEYIEKFRERYSYHTVAGDLIETLGRV